MGLIANLHDGLGGGLRNSDSQFARRWAVPRSPPQNSLSVTRIENSPSKDTAQWVLALSPMCRPRRIVL